MVNGNEEINIKELEESATYEGGYSRETAVIRYVKSDLGISGISCIS